MNPKVDEYIAKKAQDWQEPILQTLRKAILECGLKEEVKWGGPAYTHHGNVLGIGAFKKHIALCFFEGATLKDASKVLMNAQEGKTSAMRQWRIEEGDDLDIALIKEYVSEAALNMEKGIKTPKKIEVVVPELLQTAFDAEPEVKNIFEAMAPSHRREYSEHITAAEQEATKLRRLEKFMTLLKEGKGLHDKYKNC